MTERKRCLERFSIFHKKLTFGNLLFTEVRRATTYYFPCFPAFSVGIEFDFRRADMAHGEHFFLTIRNLGTSLWTPKRDFAVVENDASRRRRPSNDA